MLAGGVPITPAVFVIFLGQYHHGNGLNCWCACLYSEDMQHGLTIEEKLQIRNPFL